MSDHQYWCAATSEGDRELLFEKRLSILHHITDVHGVHEERFTTCLHGDLVDKDIFKRNVIMWAMAYLTIEPLVCRYPCKSLQYCYEAILVKIPITSLFLGSLASQEIGTIVKGRLLTQNVKKLSSPADQTLALESYHNVVCPFAPNALHFFYSTIRGR